MLRRDFGTGMLSAVFARHAVAAFEPNSGQPLHVFKRERACIYLLGFGEAKDESWATPQVRRAFQESSDLGLEVSHDPESEPDAAARLSRRPDGQPPPAREKRAVHAPRESRSSRTPSANLHSTEDAKARSTASSADDGGMQGSSVPGMGRNRTRRWRTMKVPTMLLQNPIAATRLLFGCVTSCGAARSVGASVLAPATSRIVQTVSVTVASGAAFRKVRCRGARLFAGSLIRAAERYRISPFDSRWTRTTKVRPAAEASGSRRSAN